MMENTISTETPEATRSAAWQCEYTEAEKQQIESWNKTVNRIRVHYGLEPFPEKVDSEE